MDTQERRRAQLRKWIAGNSVPPKEKSYFSQLLSGTASFGERAARRIEDDYGMGRGYLDSAENAPAATPPESELADVAELVLLYGQLEKQDREKALAMMRTMRDKLTVNGGGRASANNEG